MKPITKIRNKLNTLTLDVTKAIVLSPKDEDIYGQIYDHIKSCEQLLKVIEEYGSPQK
jgi:hypothetical protein